MCSIFNIFQKEIPKTQGKKIMCLILKCIYEIHHADCTIPSFIYGDIIILDHLVDYPLSYLEASTHLWDLHIVRKHTMKQYSHKVLIMASNCASPSKVTWHNPLFSSFKTASNMSLASSHRASLGFFFFFKKNNTYLIIFTKMSLFLSSYGCYECDFCLWYEKCKLPAHGTPQTTWE